MSLEDTIINDINVSLATIENPFTTINTEKINIDGLTLFRENDNFYTKNEETGTINKLSGDYNGQDYKWYKIRERDDLVYLDGDLIIDNIIYLNGNVFDNTDISAYSSNIDNTVIKFLGLGFGTIKNNFKEKSVSSDYIVVNDAWKQFNNKDGELNVFTSKSLIVNGNIYVKNKFDNIVSSNIHITDLNNRRFTAEEIILGTSQWKNIDNKLYIDKTVWINGNVIAKGNIYNYCNYYDTNNENHKVILPDEYNNIDTVNIKDNLIVNNHKNILNNEQIEISGNDIHILGSNIYIDGELFFHQKYIQVLKEIYEHSVIYNAAGLMQKRTAFTGQIPITHGSKHEIGYDIIWTTNPSNYDIFKISGDIFLSDTKTTQENGFRIITDFILTINPIDDGLNYPGLDVMFNINNRYKLGILEKLIDIKVIRVSAKHIKLSMNWETTSTYTELYYASIDITAIIPNKLGRRLLITPYHKIYDGDEVEIVSLLDIKPFIKLDLSDYDETTNDISNLYYQNVDIANMKVLGEGGVNDRTSLTVYKTSLDDNIHIAEFWDKNANAILSDNCMDCLDNHYNNTIQGVVIGKSGIVCIGIEEKNKAYSIIEGHTNSNLAQLNIMSKDKDINRINILGKHDRASIFDVNANLIIGNSTEFNQRTHIQKPMINNYALDVNGHTLIKGSLMLNHNNILRSYFSVKNIEMQATRKNIIEMYITWEINEEDSYNIYQPINLDIAYYISSIDLYPIKSRIQSYSILLNPRNNIDMNMPNIITVLEKEGQTSSIFNNLNIIGSREDYNTVKIIIDSEFATLTTQHPFSTIAYANVEITGESLLKQFLVNNKLDFFGILELPQVDNIDLLLSIGVNTIDLYSLFNITDIDRASFEVIDKSNDDIEAYIQNERLQIKTFARGIDYSLKIKVLNRRYQVVDIPLTIYVTEIPAIHPINGYTAHVISELVIDVIDVYLYSFYNIYNILDTTSQRKYSWDFIKNRVRFQSTQSIDNETAVLKIRGNQSGLEKNIEISAYYLNNEGTDYILIDSSLNIKYTEIKKIKSLHSTVVNISLEGMTSLTLDLLTYYDSPNADKIRFTYLGDNLAVNKISNNVNITFDSTDNNKKIDIIAYYDGYYNTTLNTNLSFYIEDDSIE